MLSNLHYLTHLQSGGNYYCETCNKKIKNDNIEYIKDDNCQLPEHNKSKKEKKKKSKKSKKI